jgi:hypothetical protein
MSQHKNRPVTQIQTKPVRSTNNFRKAQICKFAGLIFLDIRTFRKSGNLPIWDLQTGEMKGKPT